MRSTDETKAKISVIKNLIIDDVWPDVLPLLQPSIDQNYGTETAEDVLNDLRLDARILLTATVHGKLKGAAVLGFRDGNKRIMEIQYLGGSGFKNWGDEMKQAIDVVAAKEDVDLIIAFGRDAWIKIWKDFGNTGKMLYVKEVAR